MPVACRDKGSELTAGMMEERAMNKKIWLSLSVGLCVGMIPAVA